jgi:hypothetical protein
MHWDRATATAVVRVFRSIIVTSFLIGRALDHAHGHHPRHDHDRPFNPIPGRHT